MPVRHIPPHRCRQGCRGCRDGSRVSSEFRGACQAQPHTQVQAGVQGVQGV